MNFDKVISNLAGSGVLGGLAGGAVSGAIMSNKKARKTAGTVLKVGGLAALGGMAWKAYQGYNAQQNPGTGVETPQVATNTPANPVWSGVNEKGFAIDENDVSPGSRSLLLIQAMIAAACADGHLDAREREQILARVGEFGLDPDEKALVFDSMQQPLSLTDIAQRVDCPELAAEVYMASALVVDSSLIASELYLDALAFRLGLPEGLVKQMHEQLPAPSPVAA